MLSLRLAVVSAAAMFAIACGGYSSPSYTVTDANARADAGAGRRGLVPSRFLSAPNPSGIEPSRPTN